MRGDIAPTLDTGGGGEDRQHGTAMRHARKPVQRGRQHEGARPATGSAEKLAALVAGRAPATRRAAVVGLFSAVFLVGQMTGAVAFGYVAHALGYASMWTILTSSC